MRRGSEPALLNNINDNNAVTTGSVQAVIASINARSTSVSAPHQNSPTSSTSVPRSMSSHSGLGIIKNNNISDSNNHVNMLLLPPAGSAGSNSSHNNSLRSSLRKTMVNTSYGYSIPIDDRSNQQSSPDSQFEGDSSGSLSVMRRREPLGASGNKPERPK